MTKIITMIVWTVLLASPMAWAQDSAPALTPAQEQLWAKTKAKLEKYYAENKLTPVPMAASEIESIRVPLTIGGTETGPLPWDVKLLLGFDRNLTLEGCGADQRMMQYLFDEKLKPYQVFTPSGLVSLFHDFAKFGNGYPTDVGKMTEAFMGKAKDIPVVISLAQLGGDELPGLWLIQTPSGHTPVLHFDYDDFPEFYFRNASVLDYVAAFIDGDPFKLVIDDPYYADECYYIDKKEAWADFDAVAARLSTLNKAVEAAVTIEDKPAQ